MAKYSDRVFGQNVDPETIKIFNKLQDGYIPDPLDQVGDNQGTMALGGTVSAEKDYLGKENTFARMWVAILVEEELTTTDETSNEEKKETTEKIVYYVINDNRDKSASSYEANESVESDIFTELTDNPLLKPRAGITSITTKTEGALGAILRTDVEFVVHNKKDFDQIFLPFFLKPGATIILDYGRNSKNAELYNIEGLIYNDDTKLSYLKEYIYGTENKQGYVKKNYGKVEVVIGKVLDYNVSVNEQGSFVCSISLTSENTVALDKEVTYDNKLKYVFKNQIEDIIIGVLGGGDDAHLRQYSAYSAKEKKEARNSLYDKLGLTGDINEGVEESGTLISSNSLKTGLYYQDIIDTKKPHSVDRETLYISIGLFEDLFLNGIIAGHLSAKKHDVGFNFKDAFIRYDDNLFKRQKQVLGTGERLPLFLYPSNWRDTYNNRIRDGKKLSNTEYRQHKRLLVGDEQYDNIYKTKIMPLRDLFISVELISSTFAKKQNVNDALDSILEKINRDSYDVFKLKMSTLNKSNSAISIQDSNLLPVIEKEEETLIFDVTSFKSIVKSMEYKLEMPKGGLDSVIAIGNSGTDYSFFNDPAKDNLNFLRMLQKYEDGSGKIIDFRSLPLPAKKEEGSSVDKKKKKKEDETLKIFEFGTKLAKNFSIPIDTSVTNMKSSFKSAVQSVQNRDQSKNKVSATDYNEEEDVEDYEARGRVATNSFRDYYGKEAQIKTLLGNSPSSVSPIMPLSLSLTVFGNSYLNVGDIININFLPESYMDRIFFQILGVEHKIDSDWSTTYRTQMRIKPTTKGRVISQNIIPKPVLDKKFTRNMTNDDGQLGKRVVAVGHSIPLQVDDKIQLKVTGLIVDNHINNITFNKSKKVDKTPSFKNNTERFNFVRMEFGKEPKTAQDVAFLFAFQKAMGYCMNKKRGNALTAPDGKPYSRAYGAVIDFKYDGIYNAFIDGEIDFYTLCYYQDDNWVGPEKSSLNDFLAPLMKTILGPNYKKYGGLSLIRKNIQELTKALWGKDPWITENFTEIVHDGIENKTTPLGTSVASLGDTPTALDVNKEYGVIARTYLLKVAERNEEFNKKQDSRIASLPFNNEGIYKTYEFNIDIPGVSKDFVPMIKLPEWFVTNVSVNDFLEIFQATYKYAIVEVTDMFTKFREVVNPKK